MKNWDDLRYYLAVARTGTLSAAAKQLGVSHATVLRRIDQLEQDLGVKLFRRLQQGYPLTDSGQRLFDQAQMMEAQSHRISRDLRGQDSLAGMLTITQPEVSVLNLYPLYAEFRRQYPEILLNIVPSSEVLNLNQQQADVAFRMTQTPDELLVGRHLGGVQLRAYASQTYLNQFDEPPLSSQVDWILWNDPKRHEIGSRQQDWLMKLIPRAQVIIYTSGVADVVAAVQSGLGVGLIADSVAKPLVGLVSLPYDNLISQLQLWMLTHRDLRHSPRVQLFMEFMSRRAQSYL